MAIRLVTGTPGSGKSFYCVKHLVDNYYSRDGGVLRVKDGFTVITNLDNFKLEHLKLDDVVKKAGMTLERFFTVDYQKKIMEKYGKLIYVIDECQRYFDEYFRNKETIFFFEYHRHLGFDVYLVSQSPNRICRAIRDLAEVEIRASRRIVSFIGELKYKILVGGEIIENKVLRRDKEIFRLYKSMDGSESEKIKNPLVKWVAICVCVGGVGIALFYYTFFGGPSGRSKKDVGSPGSALAASPSSPVASSGEVPRSLCVMDFAAIGDDVFVFDAVSCQLVPADKFGADLIVKRKNKSVVGVYAYLSGDALIAHKIRAGLPAPAGGGEVRAASSPLTPKIKQK